MRELQHSGWVLQLATPAASLWIWRYLDVYCSRTPGLAVRGGSNVTEFISPGWFSSCSWESGIDGCPASFMPSANDSSGLRPLLQGHPIVKTQQRLSEWGEGHPSPAAQMEQLPSGAVLALETSRCGRIIWCFGTFFIFLNRRLEFLPRKHL